MKCESLSIILSPKMSRFSILEMFPF